MHPLKVVAALLFVSNRALQAPTVEFILCGVCSVRFTVFVQFEASER